MDTSLWRGLAESGAYEWTLILSFVFGGCCSNVWALESVLHQHPKSGTFLTFAQFLYVAVQSLSSQLYLPPKPLRLLGLPIPRLRPRKVPLTRWLVQVVFFVAISLMNNFAFGLKIPVTVHIIFRSGGLCVSMLMGWWYGGRRYSFGQLCAGVMITVGIVVATISAPRPRRSGVTTSESGTGGNSWTGDHLEYLGGIGLLLGALLLSGWMGLFQEETYRKYGKQWRESLFYSHFLSLPFFIPLYPTLSSTFSSFLETSPVRLFSVPPPRAFTTLLGFDRYGKPLTGWRDVVVPGAILALTLNVVTQGICIRGVNRLTTRVNNVTVNLVLTLRKAVSLGMSVWYYGSGFTAGLALGGAMVLGGTLLYSVAPAPSVAALAPSEKHEDGVHGGTALEPTGSSTALQTEPANGLRPRSGARDTKVR